MPILLAIASLIVALVLHAVAAQSVTAQAGGGSPSAAELQHAATLFAASDWKQAHEAYAALAKQFPTHPHPRRRRLSSPLTAASKAVDLRHLDEPDLAIAVADPHPARRGGGGR